VPSSNRKKNRIQMRKVEELARTPLCRLALLLACIVAAAACGGGPSDDIDKGAGTEPAASEAASETTAGGGEAPEGRAALVVAQGGLGDESYNDLALEGFNRGLEANGMEGQPVESDDIVAQGEQILRRAAGSDFGLVVDLEFTHGEILGPVAQEFPDVQWAIANTVVDADNVTSLLFAEHEGSYLAGALAALMTSTEDNEKVNPEKVIGVVGGTKSTGIDKFIVGFIQGARDVDEEVEVLTSYTDDFGDPALGREQANAMFEQGADIIYHVAGGTGQGVIEAAADANRYAIGVDTDQDGLAPGNVLTSMVKRIDVAVEETVTRWANGELTGGETLDFGLAEDGVGLTEFTHTREEIPEEFIQQIEDLRGQIESGELEVWNVIDQGYPDFYSE
jgi:basic membrane protein A and related proteins